MEREGGFVALDVLVGCAGGGDAGANGDGGSAGSVDRREDFFRGVAPSCDDTTASSSSSPEEDDGEVFFIGSSGEGSDCGGGAGRDVRLKWLAGPRVRRHRRGVVFQS